MTTQSRSRRRKNATLVIIAAIIFILVDALFIYNTFYPESSDRFYDSLRSSLSPKDRSGDKEAEQEDDNDQPIEPIKQNITYNEVPVTPDGHFFEKTPTIGGQAAYIAHPIEIDPEDPPTIIVYSHGSITLITNDFSDEFMLEMRSYGDFFTKQNYIFAASNEHGENWGSAQSVEDIRAMVEWIQSRYETEPKVYLTGHSMGGLPTFEYAFAYPDTVAKIGLLAPTTRPSVWTAEEMQSLNDKPVKIWHGEADVNVGSFLSSNFKTAADAHGNNIDLVLLPGVDHWGVDTELMDELLLFFNE